MRAFSGFTFRFYVLRLGTWLLGQHFSILIMVYMSTMYEHTLHSMEVEVAVAVARLAAAESPSGRSHGGRELPACLPANGATDCRRSLRLTVCVFINPFGRVDGVLIGVEPIGQ